MSSQTKSRDVSTLDGTQGGPHTNGWFTLVISVSIVKREQEQHKDKHGAVDKRSPPTSVTRVRFAYSPSHVD